jgi:iron complex transport system permease protein
VPGAAVKLGLALLGVALLALASLSVGPGEFSVAESSAWLFGGEAKESADAILGSLRLPRILLALLVGGSLGCAGALTQGLFRNPLASPSVLGLPTGAATAVVAGFVFGLDAQALWVTPLLAFIGAFVMLLLLFALSAGQRDATMLLLSGVALGALMGAITTCLLAFRLEQWDLARRSLAWMMGSFDGRGWSHLRWAGPPMGIGMVLAFTLYRGLDLLYLGEDAAGSLGLDPVRMRQATAAVVALLVGAATAAAGAIVFVGLIVPHIVRPFVGPGHGPLLAGSIIGGGALVLAIDTVSRGLAPMSIAPGALSALIGGAFFLLLLRRQRIGGER